jgi:hypothetical protein
LCTVAANVRAVPTFIGLDGPEMVMEAARGGGGGGAWLL